MLNQSYEPLTLCTLKRAILLLLLGKAEIIAINKSRIIRTVRGIIEAPSIIKITRYINIPYRRVVLTRKNILKRDGFRCVYCGKSETTLTVDHVIPKARGGKDDWENLVCACITCNNRKGDRTPSEAGLKMRVKPYTPNHVLFIKKSVEKIDEQWKPYLYS